VKQIKPDISAARATAGTRGSYSRIDFIAIPFAHSPIRQSHTANLATVLRQRD
jgi:hypothetical protein